MTAGRDNQLYLSVVEGRARGVDLLVSREIMLGRAAGSLEARLGDDPELSRRNARVTRAEDGSLTIEDLGSTNGTYVNDEQISAPRKLRPGDRLWVGATTLEVRATPPGEMPARWASPAAAAEARGAPAPSAVQAPARAETSVISPISGSVSSISEISIDPAPITVSRWVVLVVLALGTFVTVLDTSIVTVALPSISSHLHASLSEVLWIVNSYVLVFAILLITFGRLGETVGPKNLFISGLGIFVTASLLCGLANSAGLLIVFRIVQGIGAAMLLPQTLALITHMFPPEERGQAVGVWGAVAGLAVVAGPLLGGVLTEDVSWRAIFFLNVPIGIVGMIAALLLVPRVQTREKHSLDLVGVVLVGAGLGAIVYGLVEGQTYNWGRISSTLKFDLFGAHVSLWSIPSILFYGVVLLVAFFFWERRQSEPLLPLKLFDDRNFSICSFSQGAVNFAVLGLFLSATIYLQSVLGFSAIKTGLAFLPLAAGVVVGSGIGGALVDKANGKWVLPFGLLMMAVGLVYTVAAVSPTGKFIDTVPPFVIFGVGMGLSYTSVTTLAVRNINPADGGPASGFIETSGQIGASAGSAIAGAILLVRLASAQKAEAIKFSTQLPSQARGQFVQSFSHGSASALNVGSGASTPAHPASSLAAQTAHASAEVFQHAYVTAMRGALIGALAVAVLTMLITLAIKTPKYHRSRTVSESGVFSFPRA
jgi:EmrB/QacA subfamily drug resistance transporter